MCHNCKSCFSLPSHFLIWLITILCLCDVYFTQLKAAAQLSGDAEADPANEATASPMVNPEEDKIERKKILDSQYKCFEKMNRDLPYNKSGRGSNYCGSLQRLINVLQVCFFFLTLLLFVGFAGLYCSRNWDGWLCWDDTPAGTYTSQNCPNYFVDFDPTGEQ